MPYGGRILGSVSTEIADTDIAAIVDGITGGQSSMGDVLDILETIRDLSTDTVAFLGAEYMGPLTDTAIALNDGYGRPYPRLIYEDMHNALYTYDDESVLEMLLYYLRYGLIDADADMSYMAKLEDTVRNALVDYDSTSYLELINNNLNEIKDLLEHVYDDSQHAIRTI